MTTINFAYQLTEETKRQARILSRIYGYKITKGKETEITVIEAEAEVIRNVVITLASTPYKTCKTILQDLVQEFKEEGVRFRGQRNFDVRILASLCRPIYAGLEEGIFGTWASVCNYPEIISPEYLKRAYKRLKAEKLL